MAELDRKVRSAGRAWMMGDVAMIADGQWAVAATSRVERKQDEAAVEARLADGQRLELTLEELARAVGVADPGARRDQAAD